MGGRILNPDSIRLSRSFLLSDFMGCDSVYRKGYQNLIEDDQDLLNEGAALAEFLDKCIDLLGPCSVSYGYISPDLSKRVVHYQDPRKPSYHRWDAGAAADVCFHDHIRKRNPRNAPILAAHLIDSELPEYSRMITYSESPWICLAVRSYEEPRLAFYENRYVGERKPVFIRKSGKSAKPTYKEIEGWRGQGYPSYHGGGRLQFQHNRVSKYSMLSDFLYSRRAVSLPTKNLPLSCYPKKRDKFIRVARAAGSVIDDVVLSIGNRVSIIQGAESKATNPDGNTWEERFSMLLTPPEGVTLRELCSVLRNNDLVEHTMVNRKRNMIKVEGGKF